MLELLWKNRKRKFRKKTAKEKAEDAVIDTDMVVAMAKAVEIMPL